MTTTLQPPTKQLCDVLRANPKDSEKIFEKIFDLLQKDSDGLLSWRDICHGYCDDSMATTPLDLMTQYFYKDGRLIMKNERYHYDKNVPSILLLQLLLYIIQRVKNEFSDNVDFLKKFRDAANASDGNGILSGGIHDELEYIKFVTSENIYDLESAVNAIKDEFNDLGIDYEGNYTLGQVVGIYCEKLLEIRKTGEKPTSIKGLRPVSRRFTNPESYTWHNTVFRYPTIEEVRHYNQTKTIQPVPQADGDKIRGYSSKFKDPVLDVLKQELARIKANTTGSNPSKLTPPHPVCKYGSNCNRKNYRHILEYHPEKIKPYKTPWKPGGGSGTSKRTRRRLSSKRRTRHHRTRARRRN
jgi:hypothetical protein